MTNDDPGLHYTESEAIDWTLFDNADWLWEIDNIPMTGPDVPGWEIFYPGILNLISKLSPSLMQVRPILEIKTLIHRNYLQEKLKGKFWGHFEDITYKLLLPLHSRPSMLASENILKWVSFSHFSALPGMPITTIFQQQHILIPVYPTFTLQSVIIYILPGKNLSSNS